ncbi:helix-turn-helix transcriptional regulator [Olivibacter sp. SDN3]|uniref:helix-turn-helix transcriptional regulator n=1 Tax=Olivibacter sp. SDN3 TaxID=2764720 RepID=UPI00165160CC|nr:helix-turn-helix transcriptional regulator [Olivibacter sp. SDN3]QNL48142.1 helix-turn-helix transcriptional regulator [Olivibacter sp. SDN3]
MTKTLLENLRIENKYEKDQLAAVIDVSISEYALIESGVVKPTFDQAGKLGAYYGIDPKHILGVSDSTNYNIGTYSRTIYSVNYYESEEKDSEK